MTYLAKPKLHHPELPTNELGFTRRDYEGAISTLCAGCGHDSISAAIVHACFELSLPPHRIAKLSGIGCSSKTPTYFLGNSHGFNSVHGRMPSVLTGAYLANRDLIYLGVSGDGDSASIGLGQFAHALRRGVDMVYIVENSTFDQRDVAGAAMLDVGDRRTVELGDLDKIENAFVDVEKRHVAAEAAGKRGRRDAHFRQGGAVRGRAHRVSSTAQRVASSLIGSRS